MHWEGELCIQDGGALHPEGVGQNTPPPTQDTKDTTEYGQQGGGTHPMGSAARVRGVCIGQRGLCTQAGGALHPEGVGQNTPSPPTQDTKDTTEYGQQGGGTHPTGMHSCCLIR